MTVKGFWRDRRQFRNRRTMTGKHVNCETCNQRIATLMGNGLIAIAEPRVNISQPVVVLIHMLRYEGRCSCGEPFALLVQPETFIPGEQSLTRSPLRVRYSSTRARHGSVDDS